MSALNRVQRGRGGRPRNRAGRRGRSVDAHPKLARAGAGPPGPTSVVEPPCSSESRVAVRRIPGKTRSRRTTGVSMRALALGGSESERLGGAGNGRLKPGDRLEISARRAFTRLPLGSGAPRASDGVRHHPLELRAIKPPPPPPSREQHRAFSSTHPPAPK